MKNSKLLFTLCVFMCVSQTLTKSVDELTNFKNTLEKNFKDSLENAYKEVENKILQKENTVKTSNFHKKRKLNAVVKSKSNASPHIIIRKLVIKKRKNPKPTKRRELSSPFDIMGPLHFLQQLEGQRSHGPQIHGVITEIKRIPDGHGHYVTEEFHKNLGSNDVINMTNNFNNGIFPDLENSDNLVNNRIHVIPLESQGDGIHIIPLSSFQNSPVEQEDDFSHLIPLNEESEVDDIPNRSGIAQMLGDIISQNTNNLHEDVEKPVEIYHHQELEPETILNDPEHHEIEITKTIPMSEFVREGPQKIIGDIVNQISGGANQNEVHEDNLHDVISNIVNNNEHVQNDNQRLNPFENLEDDQGEEGNQHQALSLAELLNGNATQNDQNDEDHDQGLTLNDILSGNIPHSHEEEDLHQEDTHDLSLEDILSGRQPDVQVVEHPEAISLGDLLNAQQPEVHEEEDHPSFSLGDLLNNQQPEVHEEEDHPEVLSLGDLLNSQQPEVHEEEDHVLSLGDLLNSQQPEVHEEEDHVLSLGDLLNNQQPEVHEEEDHPSFSLQDLLNNQQPEVHEEEDHPSFSLQDSLNNQQPEVHEEEDHPSFSLQDLLSGNLPNAQDNLPHAHPLHTPNVGGQYKNRRNITHKNYFPSIGHKNQKRFQPSFGDILSKLLGGAVDNNKVITDNDVDQSHEALNHFEHVETPTHHYLTKVDAEQHKIPKENAGGILPMILQGLMGGMGNGENMI